MTSTPAAATRLSVARRAHPEVQLQISVVQFLRLAMPDNLLWFHVPNGEHRDVRTAAKLKAMGTTPGVPDLLVLLPHGRLGCIELKAAKGRVSPVQSDWMLKAQRHGAYVAVCRSLEDVESALTGWLSPLGYNLKISLRSAA